MDFTDLNASRYLPNATASNVTVSNSDLEGAAWGFVNFADANSAIVNMSVVNNICDGFTFACYAFITVPAYTHGVGSSQNLSIDDTRWLTSWGYGVLLVSRAASPLPN
jgi:hypothetical protein